MKVEELRVGNFLRDDNEPDITFIEVDLNLFSALDLGLYSIDDLRPIPLTEQWLERFGFKRENNQFFKGPYAIWRPPFYKNWNFEDITSVEYVHQLQNLYYALNGEEL